MERLSEAGDSLAPEPQAPEEQSCKNATDVSRRVYAPSWAEPGLRQIPCKNSTDAKPCWHRYHLQVGREN